MNQWTVPELDAGKEIGADEVQRLKGLRSWLYSIDADRELSFRTAPSLVARCEVELFDISMPRFALRAYLTERSFVNARRTVTFCRLATTWGEAPLDHPGGVATQAADDTPGKRIQSSSSCIGDSLLEPPKEKCQGYHVLTTELGKAYGERREIFGTPFVNHIRLGGGMCAQAVCFMATALMQESARGIFGVAEITALASPQDEPFLDLGGMNAAKICHYFNDPRVGLSALSQAVFASRDGALDHRLFAEAMRSYMLSDLPVILMVDFGRMCGVRNNPGKREPVDPCIFSENGLLDLDVVRSCRERVETNPSTTRPHAILIVGCEEAKRSELRTDTRNWRFLINDPTTYPFLKASAAGLAEIRPYVDDEGRASGRLAPIQFISVAPQEVRLPLLESICESGPQPGLFQLARQLQEDSIGLPQFTDSLSPHGDVHLVDLRWYRSADGVCRLNRRLRHIETEGLKSLLECLREGRFAAKWAWVQYGEHREDGSASIWVWDATVPPPPPGLRYIARSKTGSGPKAVEGPVTLEELTDMADADLSPQVLRDKYLLAVLEKQGRDWFVKYPYSQVGKPKLDSIEQWLVPNPASVGLRPAVISSFHVDQAPAIKKAFPDGAAVDLYAFMLPEVRRLCRGEGYQFNSAVEAMARLADDRDMIRRWASDTTALFRPDHGQPIIALTSFVPEVTSTQPEAYRRARDAMRFLLRFAHALRENRQPLRTIELVAGSRIGSIWPTKRPKGQYAALQMDDKKARRRILSLLGEVLAEYADQAPAERVFLSIEAEPGPLFLLRDWGSLRDLCCEINEEPLLSKFVGVNLDIAHWRLARDISPERVWDAPQVRNRIVHAHLAGHHHCSHLGDLHVDDLNKRDDFWPWIDLLRCIAADWRHPNQPQFSGYVSLEYEAAKERSDVEGGFAAMRKILRV